MVLRMAPSPPRVLAIVDDLMFRSRIEAVAEAAGVALTVAREATRSGQETLALVDLSPGDAAVDAIRALKSREPTPVVVAFGPHRDVALFARAREAGADQVLARSAFVERLPGLLTTPREAPAR